MYADAEAVGVRLGRTLTDAEAETATAVIASVTGLIAEAVGKAADWVASPVPATFSVLCVEKAVGAIVNPAGLSSEMEQLGQYQHQAGYPEGSAICLTDAEGRQARKALYGTNVGSASPDSIVTETEGMTWLEQMRIRWAEVAQQQDEGDFEVP